MLEKDAAQDMAGRKFFTRCICVDVLVQHIPVVRAEYLGACMSVNLSAQIRLLLTTGRIINDCFPFFGWVR